MKLLFSVKQLGKKRPFIDAKSIEINENIQTLKDLLTQVVIEQVQEFNQKIIDNSKEKNLFQYFQEHELEHEATLGKVRFGAIYNDKQANQEKAVETVLLAFFDGLIAVFVDDNQIETLDTTLTLQENSRITFVRLTFLAGGLW